MSNKSKEELAKENKALKEDLQRTDLQRREAEEQLAKVAPADTPTPIKVELPKEVAEEYELVDWIGSHKQVFGKHGTIDITKMTLQRAANLVKKKWPKLRAKS